MRRFLTQSLLFAALIIITLTAGWLYSPVNESHYMYAYRQKEVMLDSVPSPRLIFIGGSNLAFGLISPRIADSLGINVVNYGLHASIGLKFMMDDVEPRLRPGDIAVIVPEYQQFYSLMYGEQESLTHVIHIGGIEKCATLNFDQWATAIAGVPKYILSAYRYKESNDPYEAYSSLGFNSYGDNVSHFRQPRNKNVMPIPITQNISDSGCLYVADKIKQWRERGIQTVLLPPVTIESNYEQNKDKVSEIYIRMEHLGTPFAAEASAHVQHDTCAYDTPFHMTYAGASRFTDSIIAEIRNFMAGL